MLSDAQILSRMTDLSLKARGGEAKIIVTDTHGYMVFRDALMRNKVEHGRNGETYTHSDLARKGWVNTMFNGAPVVEIKDAAPGLQLVGVKDGWDGPVSYRKVKESRE